MIMCRTGCEPLRLFAAVMFAVVVGSGPVWAESQLEAARSCSQESQRLERLACFDRVFATPVTVTTLTDMQIHRPAQWQQAYAQEQSRTPEDGVLYRHTGADAGHLITTPALGAVPPRPVLAIQCHNHITELSLMLPQPLAEERVALSFTAMGGNGAQLWRARDEGFVLSGGRGLPAIATIKAMLPLAQLEVASANAVVGGLVFDLGKLPAELVPLRAACGW